jgi:hypothetical protein
VTIPYTHPNNPYYPTVENDLEGDPTPKSEAVWIMSVTPNYAMDVYAQRWNRPTPTAPQDLNFLDPKNNLLRISHVMSSAGQALNQKKPCIVTQRNRQTTRLYVDSGGFQIASGRLHINNDDDRLAILRWQEKHGDVGLTLDVPTGPVLRDPHYRWKTSAECLTTTCDHLAFYRKNRQSTDLKLLNVLQGNDPTEADIWYDAVKQYEFDGWAFAGRMRQNIAYLLRRIIVMANEQQLEGKNYIHVLGTADLETAVMLTAIQRGLHRHFPNLRISFDTSTPFRQVGWNQAFTLPHFTINQMTMPTVEAPDDPRFINSDIPWPWPSPLGDKMKMGDFCVRKPVTSSTSSCLDTQSYHYLAHHNLSMQCWAIRLANRVFDAHTLTRPAIALPVHAAVIAIGEVLQKFDLVTIKKHLPIFDALSHSGPYDTGDDERTFDYQAV